VPADAEGGKTRVRLAYALNQILAGHRLYKAQAAKRPGISQPEVSALANHGLDGFSAFAQYVEGRRREVTQVEMSVLS